MRVPEYEVLLPLKRRGPEQQLELPAYAIGDQLPDAYERKRRQWTLALREARWATPGEASETADREAPG